MKKKRKKFSRANFVGHTMNSVQQSINRQESMGVFNSIFKNDITCTQWRPKEGSHCIDVIPYCAGEYDPNTKEDAVTHVLDLWVHKFVGPENDEHIVCPKRNYGKPCPICKEITNIQKTGDFDEIEVKKMKAKRRTLYNVVVCDGGKEEDKGVQVWDVAHFYMENKIGELARGIPGRGGIVSYPDPNTGKTIGFTIKKVGDGLPPEYQAHQFLDRNYKISDEILQSAYILDELVALHSYEKIEELFFGTKNEKVSEEEVDEEETIEEMHDTNDADDKGPLSFDDEDDDEDDDDDDEDDDDDDDYYEEEDTY